MSIPRDAEPRRSRDAVNAPDPVERLRSPGSAAVRPSPVITHVVLDTTVLHQDLLLQSRPSQRLLLAAARGWFTVCIPEVVLSEARRHYELAHEKLRTQLSAVAIAANRLGVLTDQVPAVADCEAAGRQYDRDIRARLDRSRITVGPLPNVPHQAILERDLARRKPFKSDGSGYRDTVLWLTVLSVAAQASPDGQVAFISANSSDFADSEVPRMVHADLRQDLIDADLSEDAVLVFDSMRAFVDGLGIEDRTGALIADVPAEDRSVPVPDVSLNTLRERLRDVALALVGAEIVDNATGGGEIEVDVPLPSGAYDVRLANIISDYVPEFDEASRLLSGEIQFQVSTGALLVLTASVPASTLRLPQESGGYEVLQEFDEDEVWIQFERRAWLFFLVEYDADTDAVIGIEFQDAWGR